MREMIANYTPPPELRRFQFRALVVGVALMIVLLVGVFTDRAQFFHAYLIGFILWTGIAMGSLALLMLQHLTGGAWGLVIRRVLEAATRTLPLMVVLFVPVVLGLNQIYPWTDRQKMNSAALAEKAARYLNPSFFIARAGVYFAIWLSVSYLLNRWSREHDRTADEQRLKGMRFISGPGLVLFVLTVTFAAIDWVMSLDPTWSSTMFGLLFVGSWSLSALAFTILMMAWLSRHEPLKAIVRPSHFHDLGNLLLTLVMLWTYFAFSQFLIIWSGNLPEEASWYAARTRGGWGGVALAIVILHFAFPFLMLLSRGLKRSAGELAMLAGLILLMRMVDLIWVIEPSFSPGSLHLSWMDIVAPVAIGGVWLAAFFRQLQKRSLIPINDPQLEGMLEAARP